jgi:hypothetical protein
MKKMFLTILMIAAVQFSFGQTNPTDKLFEQYNGADGFTTVHISQELFGMFAQLDDADEDMKEIKSMMSQLKYIRILMYEAEDGSQAALDDFRKEMKAFDLDGYVELMVVKEKDEEVRFMALKNGDRISELLMIIDEPGEAGFISIVGDIDINTVSKLSKTMGMEGMDKLDKLNDH